MMDCCEVVGRKRFMEVQYPCQFKRLRRLEGMNMDELEQQIMEESNSQEVNTNEINVELMEEQSNTMQTHLPDYDDDDNNNNGDQQQESNYIEEFTSSDHRSPQPGYFSMMQHPESIPSLKHYSKSDASLPHRTNSVVSCKMVGSCWYCRRQDVIVSCKSCERMTCEQNCLYCCDKCQVFVCNTCSMIDYSYRYERRLCFDCYYQHYH